MLIKWGPRPFRTSRYSLDGKLDDGAILFTLYDSEWWYKKDRYKLVHRTGEQLNFSNGFSYNKTKIFYFSSMVAAKGYAEILARKHIHDYTNTSP